MKLLYDISGSSEARIQDYLPLNFNWVKYSTGLINNLLINSGTEKIKKFLCFLRFFYNEISVMIFLKYR